MTYLFISDLHLSPDHPRLVRGFLALLEQYKNSNTQLYILGDWFNAWIGDDDSSDWLEQIMNELQLFTESGNRIFFQVGNRDFALGQKFLDRFNGELIPEVDYITIGQLKIRIEHGDALCTDDISYQKFRKIIRNPFILGFLKSTPLSFRRKLANGFRKKSHQANQMKSYDIMDVNQHAVEHALNHVDFLIHGHTHRPEIHDVHGKKRIVLGDWRENSAEILEINLETTNQELKLKTWTY
ncbi:MAG: UDP-2,3-diacylglucosamine diphosphatase [Acinetobacter sp.]|nr:UDP-2,3-diacylglucosamine diphosphatase [Acinetobacter sp.]